MTGKAVLLALLAAGTLHPQAARPPSEIEPLLAGIASYEFGDGRDSLARFSDLIRASLGDPARRKQIELRMLQFLESDATTAGKDFMFRELSVIATSASVPALAAMLPRAETAEMALYTLARIPGPAVDDALRKRLAAAEDSGKIAVIHVLGQRRDAKSVRPLAALLSSPLPGVAEAAASALSHIANGPALEALASARSRAQEPFRQRLSEAYVGCADRLAPGDSRRAIKAYRDLLTERASGMVRIRALGGLAATAPDDALPALAAAIESNDSKLEAAAVGFLAGIPGLAATKTLVAALLKLPAPGQVRVLAALAERADDSARPVVLSALHNGAPEVRAAALDALGRLGDASSVMLLAESAANGQGAVQAAARRSLYRLRGSAVNPAIVTGIQSSIGKVKAELIAAAGERGATTAADVLIQAVEDPHPDVNREAVRGLKNIAGPAQVPALIGLLLKASSAAQRRDATQTLSAVLRRTRPVSIGPVLAAYKSAPRVPRLSLIEVMGQSSSDEALPILRTGLKDTNPETVRAAILALSEWSNVAPLPDLAVAARAGANPALQTLALRGYLKLIALPSPRSPAETAALLRDAMPLAKQPAEKRTILSLLPLYPCKESLEVVQSLLADPALSAEARAAAERIQTALKLR
jgi:HEAT repeat protein